MMKLVKMGMNKFNVISRLSRLMVKNGYGDIKVKVGNEEITCVKSILMNGNDTFRKLLSDEQLNGVLELCEKCEIYSFLEIEKYYSGGYMELSNNNVCDILRFSLYYDDVKIMRLCKKYLKNHMDDGIMIEIFDMFHQMKLNNKMLNELAKLSENYINKNGFKYLNDDELLLKLNLNSLKFILNNKKLMIIDETWLLNRLLKWYKDVLKEESENQEAVDEFISILKSKIHLNEINLEELEEDSLEMLKELKLEIKEYVTDHICIKTKEVSNTELMKIINEYYIEDEDKIEINDNEMKILSRNETKGEMVKLLSSSDDIKLIEIIINIIIEMRIEEIIIPEIKNKLFMRLLYEYNISKRNRTLKCLCSFVDDCDYISTIKCLCGKEVLLMILNNDYYLNPKAKQLLIEYIQEMKLSRNDKDEMSKIVTTDKMINKLKFKDITSFSYPQSEYTFEINEEIFIKPSYDGNECEFSINPSLPDGILLDKETGIIQGKAEISTDKCEYEVKCKNNVSEKKFKISIQFWLGLFTKVNKNPFIEISDDGKIMKNTNVLYSHCYLNLKLNKGVYHIKYKFHQNESKCDAVVFGFSTNNTYSGKDIQNQITTCNFFAVNGRSQNSSKWCHIGTVVNPNLNINKHKDNSVYEMIVDMNKKEWSISHNDSDPVVFIKDLPSTLYPYVISKSQASIEVLSITKQK